VYVVAPDWFATNSGIRGGLASLSFVLPSVTRYRRTWSLTTGFQRSTRYSYISDSSMRRSTRWAGREDEVKPPFQLMVRSDDQSLSRLSSDENSLSVSSTPSVSSGSLGSGFLDPDNRQSCQLGLLIYDGFKPGKGFLCCQISPRTNNLLSNAATFGCPRPERRTFARCFGTSVLWC
jgi:hypothetical protein